MTHHNDENEGPKALVMILLLTLAFWLVVASVILTGGMI